MACDMLSLWWSTFLGETFGECLFVVFGFFLVFQGGYPALVFGST